MYEKLISHRNELFYFNSSALLKMPEIEFHVQTGVMSASSFDGITSRN